MIFTTQDKEQMLAAATALADPPQVEDYILCPADEDACYGDCDVPCVWCQP
jgi:hypothetical protein